jgi:hypothetical protein
MRLFTAVISGLFIQASGGTMADWREGIRRFNILYEARVAQINQVLHVYGLEKGCPRLLTWEIWLRDYQPDVKFTIDPQIVQA